MRSLFDRLRANYVIECTMNGKLWSFEDVYKCSISQAMQIIEEFNKQCIGPTAGV